MSNATALRHAAVVARLIAAPHNATLDVAEATAPDVIEFARVSKMGYAKVSDKTIERLLSNRAPLETLDGDQLVWVDASNDGNLDAGWCVKLADDEAEDGYTLALAEYYAPASNVVDVAEANADLDREQAERQAKADVVARTSSTAEDVAKRSNFKHDACTHDKTPKARAACRKARAKALNA